eukprot:24202-Rhodomonas_salina.1
MAFLSQESLARSEPHVTTHSLHTHAFAPTHLASASSHCAEMACFLWSEVAQMRSDEESGWRKRFVSTLVSVVFFDT